MLIKPALWGVSGPRSAAPWFWQRRPYGVWAHLASRDRNARDYSPHQRHGIATITSGGPSVPWDATPWGLSPSRPPGGSEYYWLTTGLPNLGARGTLFMVFGNKFNISDQALFAHDSGANDGWRVRINSAGGVFYTLGGVADVSFGLSVGANSTNPPYYALATRFTGDGGSMTAWLWDYAARSLSTYSSSGWGTMAGTPNQVIQRNLLWVSQRFFGTSVCTYWLGDLLSDAEVRTLIADPFAPVRPAERTLWTVPAGGGTQQISGTSAGTSSDTGAATADAALSGTSTGASADSAAAAATASVAGTSSGASTDTGAGTATAGAAGTSAGTSADTGAATATAAIAGASAGTSADSGAATASGSAALSGTSAGASADSGAMDLHVEGTATSAGTSLDTAAVTVRQAIAGTSAGTSTDGAAAALTQAISGTSAGVSSDTGAGAATAALSGTSAGVSADSGAATATSASGDAAGTSAGTSTDTGAVQAVASLSGTSAGTSADSAAAQTKLGIAGTSPGTSAGAGAIALTLEIAGTAPGVSADTAAIIALGSAPDLTPPLTLVLTSQHARTLTLTSAHTRTLEA